MDTGSQRLSLDELSLLRWLLGGVLMLLSISAVFYMDVGGEVMAAVAAAGVLAATARPDWPARVPRLVHRLAFPAIVAFFIGDIWVTGQPLPAIVRLDLLLILYRGISYRARRDDLQIVVIGLFLIVVSGVLTVSILFALQILAFTACALALLMVVTIATAAEGGSAPKLAVRGVVPPWAAHVRWRALMGRLAQASDWRLVASGAALFLGVVASSALLFLAIPRFQLENSLFLERFVVKRAMTGFNDSIKFGDITEITNDDSVAFNADISDPGQAPADPYWRMVVLDAYSNGGFRMSPRARYSYGLAGQRTGANVYAPPPAPNGPSWTIFMEAGVSRYLPLLGPFRVLRFREAQNYRYSPDLQVMSLVEEPASMTAYRVEAMPADGAPIPDRAFAASYARHGRLALMDTTLAGVSQGDRRVVARVAAGIGDARVLGARAFAERAIAALRRDHKYSQSPHYPPGPGDPLVRWMDSHEPGHCELFAGSLVLMARAAGIPARVVTGFRGGTWNGYSGNYMIRNSDAHAWTEIWDGRAQAWVREDPLGTGVDGVAASEKGDAALAALMDRSWSARFASLRVFWYRRIVNFDQQDQAQTMSAVKAAGDNSGRWLRSVLAAFGSRAKAWAKGPWSAMKVGKAFGFLLLLVAVFQAVALGRWRLSSLGSRRGTDPTRREAGRWLRRVDGPEGLVADLQRIRYGPAPTWPRPADVFRRARRASSRPRRGASSRNTS